MTKKKARSLQPGLGKKVGGQWRKCWVSMMSQGKKPPKKRKEKKTKALHPARAGPKANRRYNYWNKNKGRKPHQSQGSKQGSIPEIKQGERVKRVMRKRGGNHSY